MENVLSQCGEAIDVLSQHGVPLNCPAFELCSFAACKIISAVDSIPQIQFTMQVNLSFSSSFFKKLMNFIYFIKRELILSTNIGCSISGSRFWKEMRYPVHIPYTNLWVVAEATGDPLPDC